MGKHNYGEKELIIHLTKQVNGIGEQTASAFSMFFDNKIKLFKNFNKKYNNFKNSSGNKYLSSLQIDELNSIINKYDINFSDEIKNIWISILIKDFVDKSIIELNNTKLENLLINPFLVKAFGFVNPFEVITFYFYQKITRSVVTSWGYTIEGLLFCSGAEETDIKGFDMKVEKDGLKYHFQIKSSPNTMSVEQVRQLNNHINNIKDKKNNIPILGMTFGKEEQINNQISKYLNKETQTKIGRELWDFVSGEKDYYLKLFNLIDKIMLDKETKFSDELEKKKNELINDWKMNYGEGKESIDKYLENFM